MENERLAYQSNETEIKKDIFNFMLNDFLCSKSNDKHVKSLISGRNLYFFKGYLPTNNKQIYSFGITDNYFGEGYKLITTIDDDKVFFDLKTKSILKTNSIEKHPDMFSKEFLNFVLNKLVPEKKFRIKNCVSEWCQSSDNFIQFQNLRNSGVRVVDAIKSTWTAKALNDFGYSEILDYKILKNKISIPGSGKVMTVLYGKPQIK